MPDRAKIFIVNGNPKVRPPKAAAPQPVTTISSMSLVCFGDPNFYITSNKKASNNFIYPKIMSIWSDNGANSTNELLLLDIRTATDTVKVFYTAVQIPNHPGKMASNVRVVHNNVSTTYTNTTKITKGPVSVSILKSPTFAGLHFGMTWPATSNITKLGGAITPIFKRTVLNNGVIWYGARGRVADGFSRAGSIYGLSRSNYETNNIGAQGLADDLFLSSDEAQFLSDTVDNFATESNVFDGFVDAGDNDDGSFDPISVWDPTYSEVETILSDPDGGFFAYVDKEIAANGYGQGINQDINYIP